MYLATSEDILVLGRVLKFDVLAAACEEARQNCCKKYIRSLLLLTIYPDPDSSNIQ